MGSGQKVGMFFFFKDIVSKGGSDVEWDLGEMKEEGFDVKERSVFMDSIPDPLCVCVFLQLRQILETEFDYLATLSFWSHLWQRHCYMPARSCFLFLLDTQQGGKGDSRPCHWGGGGDL